jgi:hypothetical protein
MDGRAKPRHYIGMQHAARTHRTPAGRRYAPPGLRIATIAVALALASPARAETFVYFGEQPDGSEIFVQSSPPALRNDGRFQAWFRTVPKKPEPVTDSFGFERRYVDFLALNVADCLNKTMAATAMHYRDEQGAIVARFEMPPRDIEFRNVRGGTLGGDMLVYLCTPRPRSAKVPSAAAERPF